jgi:hypothetical protein
VSRAPKTLLIPRIEDLAALPERQRWAAASGYFKAAWEVLDELNRRLSGDITNIIQTTSGRLFIGQVTAIPETAFIYTCDIWPAAFEMMDIGACLGAAAYTGQSVYCLNEASGQLEHLLTAAEHLLCWQDANGAWVGMALPAGAIVVRGSDTAVVLTINIAAALAAFAAAEQNLAESLSFTVEIDEDSEQNELTVSLAETLAGFAEVDYALADSLAPGADDEWRKNLVVSGGVVTDEGTLLGVT